MTKEEKQLLFKDLCSRLPHGVMVSVQGGEFDSYNYPYLLTAVSKFGLDCLCKVYHPIYTPFGSPKVEDVKPYLRPMSSMTTEERRFLLKFGSVGMDENDKVFDVYPYGLKRTMPVIDFLCEHHLDFRGLIPMGLALEAKEEMYKVD